MSFSGGVPSGSRPLVYPWRPLQFPATSARSTSTTRGAGNPAAASARAFAAIAIPFGPAPKTASVATWRGYPPGSRPFPLTSPPVGWPRAGPRPGPLRLPVRVDLRADAEVEADRFEEDERGAGGVDVGGGEDAGVLFDDRRGRVVDLCILVGLDRGPGVVAVFGEERGRIDRDQGLLHAIDEVGHVLLVDDHVAAVAEPAHVAADEVLPRVGHG